MTGQPTKKRPRRTIPDKMYVLRPTPEERDLLEAIRETLPNYTNQDAVLMRYILRTAAKALGVTTATGSTTTSTP